MAYILSCLGLEKKTKKKHARQEGILVSNILGVRTLYCIDVQNLKPNLLYSLRDIPSPKLLMLPLCQKHFMCFFFSESFKVLKVKPEKVCVKNSCLGKHLQHTPSLKRNLADKNRQNILCPSISKKKRGEEEEEQQSPVKVDTRGFRYRNRKNSSQSGYKERAFLLAETVKS